MMKYIKFRKSDIEFKRVLFDRVNLYFTENNIQKTGNALLFWKSGILFASYIFAYLCLFLSQDVLLFFSSYAALGILTIFVALNIGHDAAHQTYSSNRKYNNWLLYVFDFLGASGYMWRLKHVHSHHPHVNIPDMDGDIKQSKLVRIFPNAPHLNFHKYQHIYMPILYLFYTLHWLLFRDFKDYLNTDISGKQNVSHKTKEFVKLIFGKAFYFFRMLILPYLLLPFAFKTIVLGFVIFHFAASFTVALALVSAHIGEDSVYPSPDLDGNMPSSWVRHQIDTTCDFATENKLLTHLFGGFNHHVVHHLFPNVCHVHYPRLTKILIQTCKEYHIPYKSNPSLLAAVVSHLKFLKIRSLSGLKPDWPEM